MTQIFTSMPERHRQNVADGQSARAIPAQMMTTHGQAEPGVAVIVQGRPSFVIPAADALRVATDIADALTWHKGAHRG